MGFSRNQLTVRSWPDSSDRYRTQCRHAKGPWGHAYRRTAVAVKQPLSTRKKAVSFTEVGKTLPTSGSNWILSVIKGQRTPACAP